MLTGQFRVVLWWTIVGILGAGTFQGLCMTDYENVAWVIMLLPVIVVCFFLAVALLASSLRIKNEVCEDKHGECRNKPAENKCKHDGRYPNEGRGECRQI